MELSGGLFASGPRGDTGVPPLYVVDPLLRALITDHASAPVSTDDRRAVFVRINNKSSAHAGVGGRTGLFFFFFPVIFLGHTAVFVYFTVVRRKFISNSVGRYVSSCERVCERTSFPLLRRIGGNAG